MESKTDVQMKQSKETVQNNEQKLTKQEINYSRKLHFILTILSFTTFLSYTCLVAQTNVWKFYYGENYQSILSNVFFIFEFIGGLLGIYINQHVSPVYVVYAHLTYQTIFYIIIGLFKFIENNTVKTYLTLIPAAISASFCTIFYGCILSVATRISKQHAQSVSFGNGIQGIIFMMLQLILALCYNIDNTSPDYEKQISGITIIYYTIAAVLCVLCIIFWTWFIKIAPQCAKPVAQVKWIDIILDDKYNEDAKQKLNLWQVVKQIIPMTLAIFINYITMFMLMPQFYLQIRSKAAREGTGKNSAIWNLMIMLTHYIGDWVGKSIPVWKKFSNLFTARSSMILVYVRVVVFVVVILLMVYPVIDPIIQSDAGVYICILLNDLLYGITETECWIHYQDQLKDQLERQTAAFWLNMICRVAIGLAGLINLFTVQTFKN